MSSPSTTRSRAIATVSAIALTVLVSHSAMVELPAQDAFAVFSECADGIDNDSDRAIDYPQDPQCLSMQDDSEGPTGRGLFIAVTDNQSEVRAGREANYVLSLRSERDEIKEVDVYFQMPHQTNLISASEGGHRQDELIIWNNVSVFPGREKQLYVNVNVNPFAREGLLLVAEASSEGEKAVDTTKVVEGPDPDQAQPHLRVIIDDGLTYAQAGEKLHYVIAVRNPTNVGRTFNLQATIPTNTTLTDVDGDHDLTRQHVTWTDQSIAPGDIREYRFAVRIANDAEEFTTVTSRASVAGASDTDSTTVYRGSFPAALNVYTTDGLLTAVPGALVTYDIVIENPSNKLVTEVEVNNALPMYMEYVDSSEGGHWVGKNVRWQGITVSPNGTRVLRVTGRVRSDARFGAQLKNIVRVEGYEAADITEVGDRIDGRGLTMARSEVLVTKRANRSEVRPGGTVNYTVSVQNVTDGALRNIRVEDRMDSPFVSVVSAEHGQKSGNTIAWVIPALGPGETWEVTYTVRIDPTAPHGVSIPNIVTVSGEGIETLSLTERIYTMQIGVIGKMPPTGAAFDAIFLAMTSILGAASAFAQRRKLLLPL